MIVLVVWLVPAACSSTAGTRQADPPETGTQPVQSSHRREPLLLEADFESGDFSQFDDIEAASHELQIVNAPVRTGRSAARAVVSGEEWDIGGSGYRAEATKGGAGGANQERERWFGFSTYLPHDWQIVEVPGSDVLFQIHDLPDPCETWRSPPLVLRVVGSETIWEVKWDPRSCTGADRQTEGPATIASSPIVRGRWVDWVVHVDWSYGSDGLVEVWRDGELIGTHHGPNSYNDRESMYLKIGLYRSGAAWPVGVHQRVSYFDEVRMAGTGGSYAEVAPSS